MVENLVDVGGKWRFWCIAEGLGVRPYHSPHHGIKGLGGYGSNWLCGLMGVFFVILDLKYTLVHLNLDKWCFVISTNGSLFVN